MGAILTLTLRCSTLTSRWRLLAVHISIFRGSYDIDILYDGYWEHVYERCHSNWVIWVINERTFSRKELLNNNLTIINWEFQNNRGISFFFFKWRPDEYINMMLRRWVMWWKFFQMCLLGCDINVSPLPSTNMKMAFVITWSQGKLSLTLGKYTELLFYKHLENIKNLSALHLIYGHTLSVVWENLKWWACF